MKPKEIITKWAAALRSGEYRHGLNQLKGINCFCAVGVLCDVLVKEGIGSWDGLYYLYEHKASLIHLPENILEHFPPNFDGRVQDEVMRMSDSDTDFIDIAEFVQAYADKLPPDPV